MSKMSKERKEFLSLQKRLKEFRRVGLFEGSLTLKKPEMKREINRIDALLNQLDKDEKKKLFKGKVNNFITNKKIDKEEKILEQFHTIRQLKKRYTDIINETGLTGELSKKYLRENNVTSSVRQNQEIIKDLRRALLPLVVKFNKVKTTTTETSDIKQVKDKLRELRKEGKINVNLRQSHKKLKEILSNYLIESLQAEQEQQPQQEEEDEREIIIEEKKDYVTFTPVKGKEITNPLDFANDLYDDLILKNAENNLREFFAKIQDDLLDILTRKAEKGGFKMFYTLETLMYKLHDPLQTLEEIPFKSSDKQKAVVIPYKSNREIIEETVVNLADIMTNLVQEFIKNGSDWVLDSIESLRVDFAEWTPLKGGSFIPLPKCLSHSRNGLINIKNNDELCFLYNNICHFHKPDKNRDRVSHYKRYVDEFKTEGFKFPMTADQFAKWDKLNNTRTFVFAPIIAFTGELFDLEPVYIDTKNVDCPNKVYHLLLQDEETSKYHYVYIDNISALAPYTKASKEKQFLCCNCMNWFRSQEQLDEHEKNLACFKNDCCSALMPREGTKLRFTQFQKMNRLPFQVVFDIESSMVKIIDGKKEHFPNSVCGHFYSDFGDMETQRFYGEECVIDFLEWLTSKENYIKEKMIQNEEMIMTDEDEKNFRESKECYLCKQPFPTEYNKNTALFKVRDHDHFTGKFRGACHSSCNINYNNKNFCVPVLAHNAKGYDWQLILRDVCLLSSEFRKFDCIPVNSEKFVSFSLGKFRFIDSYSFMSSSLDSLVKNLDDTEKETKVNQFRHLENYYNDVSKEKLEMLKQKGVYPYSYANGENSFDIPKLPAKKWFYDELTDTPISDKKYKRAQKVFKAFNCKTFQDYHDLYLITDVLLLTDVWEAFRAQAIKHNKLDCAQYFGVPGFTYASWQKHSMEDGEEPVELLHDYSMFLQWERSRKGGLAQVSHRYAKANNEYCPWYDPEKPKSWIHYGDMNSLYPSAMSAFPLPHSQHKWRYDYTLEDILNLDLYGETGCLVECDVETPEELHDLHNDYPLLLENKPGDFSPLMQKIADKLGYKLPKNEKLIAHVGNEKNHVCHFARLQQYHEQGLKITKIHNVLEFKQTYSMKNYVDKMMNLRKNAKNTFEKEYFKILMNALFGKTIEDQRKYNSAVICTTKKQAQKKLNSYRCKSWKKYNTWKENGDSYLDGEFMKDSFLMVDMSKHQQMFTKPIFLGCSILELSKYLMADHHYNVIKKRYGDKATLLFTDTDSLNYLIQTDNVYNDMLEDYKHYDFSAYAKDSEIWKKIETLPEHVQEEIKANSKAFGKFKDEEANDPIIELAGRCSKEYSYTLSTANLPDVKQQLENIETEIETLDDEDKIRKLNKNKEDVEKRIKKLETQSVMKGKGTPGHVLKNQCSHAMAVQMIQDLGNESRHEKENFNKKVTFNGFRTKNHHIYTERMTKTGLSVLDSKRFVCDDGISTLAWGNHKIPSV